MSQAPSSGWRTFFAHHWRDRGFWGWVWHDQLSLGAKIAVIGTAAAALVASGIVAAATFGRHPGSADTKPVLVPAGRTESGRSHASSGGQPARASATRSTRAARTRVAPVQRVTATAVRTNVVTHQRTVTNQQTILTQHTVSHSETLVRTQTVVATQTLTVFQAQTVSQAQTVTVTVPVTVVDTGTTGSG
jgi:hypothetical protein